MEAQPESCELTVSPPQTEPVHKFWIGMRRNFCFYFVTSRHTLPTVQLIIHLTCGVVLLVPLPGEDSRPGDVDRGRGVVGTVRHAVVAAGEGAHLDLEE